MLILETIGRIRREHSVKDKSIEEIARDLNKWLIDGPWLHNGGGTGARTILGAVASSTIGVAVCVKLVGTYRL